MTEPQICIFWKDKFGYTGQGAPQGWEKRKMLILLVDEANAEYPEIEHWLDYADKEYSKEFPIYLSERFRHSSNNSNSNGESVCRSAFQAVHRRWIRAKWFAIASGTGVGELIRNQF
jgi:hypothetical protein